ncbi:VOC family protein [Tengunoibacter tsumagoiensis]|uniref:VOC domain-containing protein n=1 Tax=Tengunoibacter tsumagoiensis TaxID=2014871 RepID=A0A402A7Z6_9CHLR|nr:VOC family protein [Tengunoibacter tsumagoiensis]GCE15263.1 hypothetical protein KTT_51220 [Tengunoibacter tsumagoiensis]
MEPLTAGLTELILTVKDVKKSASFYRHALGLQVQGEISEEWAWFWTGAPGQSQRIGLHKGSLPYEIYSPNSSEQRWGSVHFSFAIPADRLEAAIAGVRLQGIEVRGPQYSEEQGTASYYFYDFDGNLIAFTSPRI